MTSSAQPPHTPRNEANVAGKHSPGVYRCIHAPRVGVSVQLA